MSNIRLLKKAFGHYKVRIAVLVILSFISGFLESIGITAIIPLASFMNPGHPKGTDAISKVIEKFFASFNIEYSLKYLVFFIIAIFIVKAVVVFLADYITIYTRTSYEKKTRSALLLATLKADWPYLSEQKIGYLEQTLTNDVDNSSILFTYISMSMLVMANFFAYGLVVVNISWVVAVAVAVIGILVFLILRPLFNKNRRIAEEKANLYKTLSHHVSEHMIGMKVVKAASVWKRVMDKSEGYFQRIRELNIKTTVLGTLTRVILQPIGVVFVMAMFVFFYKASLLNLASFAVIVYAINKVFAHIQMGQTNMHMIHGLLPYLASIEQYQSAMAAHEEKDAGEQPFRFADTLEIRDVAFSYHSRMQVLNGLTATIRRGGMVGLIGPSGAGKTTVVDLLLRLLAPDRGQIRLDGVDAGDIRLDDWRGHIGYVSQDLFLLNDTVENNIRFYRDTVSDDDMHAAARMANIDEFILSLPQGFATMIGERGVKLSGGQRQRLILARILARHPDILILDEATSALDNESELLIQRAIESLRGKMTVIIIAHRLSTVKAVDRLLVLDQGNIIEEGRPDELLKNKDSYFFKVSHIRE